MTSFKQLKRIATAALAATVIVAPGFAAAQPGERSMQRENALAQFGSCVANTKNADVMVVLDESGSLRGGGGGEPTDPENIRVDSALDLVSQLSLMATDLDADVNVKLAGFGEGYRSDPETYGDWVNVKNNPGDLTAALEDARDRNNDGYTMYEDAFSGVLRDFGAHSDPNACQVVLFFTDGLLTVPGDASADGTARESICSADSPIADLRRANIQIFTVGLLPRNDESPEELLRSIAEGDECTGAPANGAFFNAGTDAVALYDAFRSLIPAPGTTEEQQSVNDIFSFVLDNSTSPVRLSAVPLTRTEPGQLIPMIAGPEGDTLDLTQGTHQLNGAEITVEESPSLPGMFDATMTLESGQSWAGEWELSYRVEGDIDADYKARMTIAPGIQMTVDELSDTAPALSNDTTLNVNLLRSDGSPAKLDGTADLKATLLANDGTSYELGSTSITDGSATVSLESIETVTTGTLQLESTITTAAAGSVPGTQLSPIYYESRLTVTPVNMPRVSPQIQTAIESESSTITLPVSGPGSVWVEDSEATDATALLPEGAEPVSITSSHSSQDNALSLGEGETGEITLTLTAPKLADGPVSLPITAHLVSSEDNAQAEVPVTITGSMRAPVSGSAFSLALVIALILALAIPLGLLYGIKFFTGRIPTRPGIRARSLPVALEAGQLVRRDTGGRFTMSYDEIMRDTVRTQASSTSVMLDGYEVRVRYGANPFTTAKAVSSSNFSVSDEGRQQGTYAELPLALHNHWFVIADQFNPDQGTVVVALDERADHKKVADTAATIATKGVERLQRVTEQAQKAAGTNVSAPGSSGETGATGESSPRTPAPTEPTPHNEGQWQANSPFGQQFPSPNTPNTPFRQNPNKNPGQPRPGGNPFTPPQ
ncbi:vWA domain-containing protein [Corynebacterium breve]|uniref:VWA domain-containing protein n=1 Tax=Corynebacterium breve TaxID=3049799 RepID=A0ABY8VJ62_9CORY|nr:vWA domain-containing protein [Corynebacterium breve]WIM67610.1 vWA domain-containing protein [Corynebacterium breve]